jgi:hypothetical protein
MALILPATAIAIIVMVELISKDPEEDETPDWARPYLPAHKGHKRKH